MTCDKCAGFIRDWMSRPISPTEVFYNDVHHKRLLVALPLIINRIIEFFERVTASHLKMARMNVKVYAFTKMTKSEDSDLTSEQFNAFLQKAEWAAMLKWCKKADNTYLSDAEMILEEGFVFKKLSFGKEWLGYCLTVLVSCVKEIHAEHSLVHLRLRTPTIVHDDDYNPYD
jgi:hypothetical protein